MNAVVYSATLAGFSAPIPNRRPHRPLVKINIGWLSQGSVC